jgi:hypothetical protein
MTRAEIDALSGRELDAAVGRMIFGFKVLDGTHYHLVDKEWHETDGEHLVLITRHETAPVAVPRYSTTYEGMGLVLESMRGKGWRYMMKGFQCGSHRHNAGFGRNMWYDTDPPGSAWADSLPEAVARAALLALAEG